MISICVCTYNRGESLRYTLDSLAKQSGVDLGEAEVLIIDNNCTDDTSSVVDAFREKLPLRRITEPCQGLAHARNKAVKEFQGDVLLFTDDDVRLGHGWFAAYANAIGRFPGADYFGGRILPDWGDAKPRWMGDEPLPLIDGALCWFDHGSETRLVEMGDPVPFGASFAIRRRLFERAGPFRIDLGAGGLGLGRGEETEFLVRARGAGAKGVYVGEALCFHAYDRRRLTPAALYRYGIACGRSHNAIVEQPHCGGYRAAAWYFAKGIFQMIKGRGDRFRQCIINAGIEVGTRRQAARETE